MRRRLRQLALAAVGAAVLGGLAVALFLTWVWHDLPPLDTLKAYEPALVTKVWDRRGSLLADYALERREIVALESMPEHLRQAFLAAEDDNFYDHFGIEPLGILRAAWANFVAGGVVQGGSTITQQVARTFFLTQKRTIMRKVREILLSLRLETNLSKDEILFLYLNQLYLGRGAYGVEAAAQLYFGKSVGDLTAAESAVLAGLPPAPSSYAPHVSPRKARVRQLYVLRRMLDLGWLSPDAYETARNEPVAIRRWEAPFWNAPYAADAIRQWLIERFGEDAVLRGGLHVYSTLDLELDRKARAAVRGGLEALDRRLGWRGPVTHVAAAARGEWLRNQARALDEVLVEHAEGSVMAWVGPTVDTADAGTAPTTTLPGPVTATIDETLEFQALVTGFTRGKAAWLDFGLGVGRIPLEAMRWARRPNPELTTIDDPVRRPEDRLKLGDVVRVGRWRLDPEAEPTDAKLFASLARVPADRRGALVLEPRQAPEVQGALVALDPKSGEVLAVAGGYDFARSQFNRALDARRQPGSAFKPIVYALALESGMTPATVIVDTPIVYEDAEREFRWKPKNYEGKFYGRMTLTDALTHSRNVVTIQLVRTLGLRPVQDMARRLGIGSPMPDDLSMALGSGVVTPLELTRAYATFAGGGRRVEPFLVREVRDATGRVVYRYEPPIEGLTAFPFDPWTEAPPPVSREVPFGLRRPNPVSAPALAEFPEAISPETAYQMTYLLRSVVERGTGWRARRTGRPAAGKTGTTDDNIDSWFVGFTPELAAGVWVGYDQLQPLGRNETGGRAAAPIWTDFIAAAVPKGAADFAIPPGIHFERVDAETGEPATPISRKTLVMPFREGQAPGGGDAGGDAEAGGAFGAPDDAFMHDPEAW